ncbi:MAG: site-2 protease family protein [Planctomycetota bacterium]
MIETIAQAGGILEWLSSGWNLLKVIIGFSVIIFVHELGHFLVAKWMDVRVDRFAIGFFTRLVGYRRGEGLTFGPRPNYRPDELSAKGYGETDYCLNALPFGGYVKMMGEDDLLINEETGEVKRTDDPRAFPNKPVGKRMLVVSSGVILNVLFAVVVYAAVYLYPGQPVLAPLIGQVQPGSAAAAAGLLPGDRILEIDGEQVRSFDTLGQRRLLADGPLAVVVERSGERVRLSLAPPEKDIESIHDVGPMFSTRVAEGAGGLEADPNGPRPGDEVVAVNGEPVRDGIDLMNAIDRAGGAPIRVTVRRPVPGKGGAFEEVSFERRARLELLPEQSSPTGEPARQGTLLGFRTRQAVSYVEPGSPAERAGFRKGDTIAQWGNIANPLVSDITEANRNSGGEPLSVVVEREGKRKTFEVTPRAGWSLSRGVPRVGLGFVPEDAPPVIADTAPGTPGAELNAPRGAVLESIGDTPVASWPDVYRALRAGAGGTVFVRYRVGEDVVDGQLRAPGNIVSDLNLPPTALFSSIAGETAAQVDGKKVRLPLEPAVRALLQRNIGRTIEVQYVPNLSVAKPVTRRFTVRADNADPWPLRAEYNYDLGVALKPVEGVISAEGNPFRALVMGVQKAGRDLGLMYTMIRKMVQGAVSESSGPVSVKHVAGPLGIIDHLMKQVDMPFAELVMFLGFISINLAVINFLPLPVVDGGLMLFLILEKIRGRPLNLKVQVITTLAGLALIALVFIAVTVNDISRMIGGA